jgi:hypothetical protein
MTIREYKPGQVWEGNGRTLEILKKDKTWYFTVKITQEKDVGTASLSSFMIRHDMKLKNEPKT